MEENKENLFVSYLYNVLEAKDEKDFDSKLQSLGDEDIATLQKDFEEQYSNMQVQKQQLGGKLESIKHLKKGGKLGKSDCPCNKIVLKKVGGKIVEECKCK